MDFIDIDTEFELNFKLFAKNEQSVADYRGGKENAAKALVGQLMKATKGQANPTVAQKLLYQELDKD